MKRIVLWLLVFMMFLGISTALASHPGDTITVDRDIYLAGEFTARTDTQYKVEHWVQNVENNDYTHITALDETYTGTTDTTATAYARSLTGVTFSEMETQNNLPTGQTLDASGTVAHISANIDGDGDTVIRFYYDRNEYTVTYKYEGTVPATDNTYTGKHPLRCNRNC